MADQTNTPNEIVAGADGRIENIDGLLAQVAQAGAQAIRTELWPELKADTAMQTRIGLGIGEGMGKQLRPWVAVGAIALSVTAGVLLYKVLASGDGGEARDNPARRWRR